MSRDKETKEKICAFYASDYHFEMASLPYIDKNIEKKNEIIILTENNLEGTMKKLLSKTNLKEDKKENIINLNWKNEHSNKFQKIQDNIKENKNVIVFVKGKEKYINETNDKIDNLFKEDNNMKIINCYNIDEVGERLDEIMTQYNKVLNTTGEKEIRKL